MRENVTLDGRCNSPVALESDRRHELLKNVTPQVDGAAEFHLAQIFLNTFEAPYVVCLENILWQRHLW
jgi:hypothetical protein